MNAGNSNNNNSKNNNSKVNPFASPAPSEPPSPIQQQQQTHLPHEHWQHRPIMSPRLYITRTSSTGSVRAIAPSPIASPSPASITSSVSTRTTTSNAKRPWRKIDSEKANDLTNILERETTLLLPKFSGINNDSNKRQRNVDGSGSGSGTGNGRGGNRRAAASNSNSNSTNSTSTNANSNNNDNNSNNNNSSSSSNNDNNDNNKNNKNNNNNNNVRGTLVVDHPIAVTSDEEDEVDEEGYVEEELETSRGQRQITGFWAKPDVQQFLVWLFNIENARRIIKPGTTAGTKLADVQREVASIVNAAMDELPPSSSGKKRTRWTAQTVKEKFRYIRDQYDKCAKLMNSTDNGDTETSTLTKTLNDITPYYDQLLMIFGTELTRNHPPLRAAAPSKATFIMDEPDLEERAPVSAFVQLGSVSLSSSRSRANPQNEHPLYASLKAVVSEFTKQNSSGSSADIGPKLTSQSESGEEMTFHIELLKREREHVERERLALEQEKQDWRKRMQRERDEWTATMEREREDMKTYINRQQNIIDEIRDDTRNYISRQHYLIDDMREEIKRAKLDLQTEKAHLHEDVAEFRMKNKDRETLVTTLAKYKVLVDGRAGSASPKGK